LLEPCLSIWPDKWSNISKAIANIGKKEPKDSTANHKTKSMAKDKNN